MSTSSSSSSASPRTRSFSIGPQDRFWLDEKPFNIRGGGLHYFRTPEPDWKDRLLRMRALGLNTVDVYIPWNV